jgi:hypothetical protein
MRGFLKAVFLLLVFFLTFSCDITDDGEKYDLIPLPIAAVEIPDSFKLNETYQFNISFIRPNSCTGFRGFEVVTEETNTHTIRHVVAIGAQFQENFCPQTAETLQTQMQFVCMYSIPYLFRFYTGDDLDGNPQYMEVEVPVE